MTSAIGEPSRGGQTLVGWDVGEVSRNSPLAIGIPAGKPHLVISVKSHSEAAGRMNL